MTVKPPEILTFGCRLNIAESEAMQRYAAAAGLENAVIINTCAVTAEAERQAGQAIRKAKRDNPNAKIIVTGCASQIDPEKFAAMPEVDRVIANEHKLDPASFGATIGVEVGASAGPLGAMQRAFIQVQNGCDNHCTFCVIPFGRGASRSVSFEAVIAEAMTRVAEGFNEIVLTGVDIASYGADLPGQPTLGFMVRRLLNEVPALPRLRLSSMDPAAFDEDLWDVIAEEPRFMPHLHLSLQSGDDMILKRMRRRHLRADVVAVVERAQKLRPDMAFGADIITGFPTETEERFSNTYNLVKDCGFVWLHVFPYSARKGTPAAKMPPVHGSLRKERAERLRELGETAAQNHYKALVGRTVKVLVEKNGFGCTPQFAKLKLLNDGPVGQIVDARPLRIENGELIAEVLGN